jgi:hypothetical protein
MWHVVAAWCLNTHLTHYGWYHCARGLARVPAGPPVAPRLGTAIVAVVAAGWITWRVTSRKEEKPTCCGEKAHH